MRLVFFAPLLGTLLCPFLHADDHCSANDNHWDHQPTVAESREQRVAAAANTNIDPGTNGGIRVHGWNNSDVLVKACVHASAPTQEEAGALLKQVNILRGSGDLEPTGPSQSHDRHWSVSYEIWMPVKSNVQAHSVNGGISLDSLDGQLRFHTQNGGISLMDVSGDVAGATQNGGLNIDLKGSAWQGAGLSAETQNGGINLHVPDGYSGNFEASTVNGGMHVDFPVQINGKVVSFHLGSGGAPIHAKTTNGSIHITKG